MTQPKHTPTPWEIQWYECKEGNKVLWKVPLSIGPVSIDHNHWAGDYLDCDEKDAALIVEAVNNYEPQKALIAELTEALSGLMNDVAIGEICAPVWEQGRAALAKAKEQET